MEKKMYCEGCKKDVNWHRDDYTNETLCNKCSGFLEGGVSGHNDGLSGSEETFNSGALEGAGIAGSKPVFKQYKRKGLSEMRPYAKGEDLKNISVAEVDDPETDMGMVARNPKNHDDQWYVARKYFDDNLELSGAVSKTLHNSTVSGARKNVKDIKVVGNGDMFQLLCKASSEKEGWMKSTKAMSVGGGCLVQVTTQQRNPDGSYAVAEALSFVPGVYIEQDENNGRKLRGTPGPDTSYHLRD